MVIIGHLTIIRASLSWGTAGYGYTMPWWPSPQIDASFHPWNAPGEADSATSGAFTESQSQGVTHQNRTETTEKEEPNQVLAWDADTCWHYCGKCIHIRRGRNLLHLFGSLPGKSARQRKSKWTRTCCIGLNWCKIQPQKTEILDWLYVFNSCSWKKGRSKVCYCHLSIAQVALLWTMETWSWHLSAWNSFGADHSAALPSVLYPAFHGMSGLIHRCCCWIPHWTMGLTENSSEYSKIHCLIAFNHMFSIFRIQNSNVGAQNPFSNTQKYCCWYIPLILPSYAYFWGVICGYCSG